MKAWITLYVVAACVVLTLPKVCAMQGDRAFEMRTNEWFQLIPDEHGYPWFVKSPTHSLDQKEFLRAISHQSHPFDFIAIDKVVDNVLSGRTDNDWFDDRSGDGLEPIALFRSVTLC